MQKKIIFFTLLVLINISLFAGTTGKLAGKVEDQNGDPVAFASVFFEELGIGNQTKENGTYIIINIPPGTYTLICQRGGFTAQKVTGVRINVDETTLQNITLTKEAIEIGGYKVQEARVEMVRRDKTNSGNTITAENIEDIAVEDIEGIIALQAGGNVVNGELHIRGGRANEVVYTVDGISVSDPVDGGAALTIDRDAIKDMKVMTGGFPAEYGNAQSGMINIVTKDGGEVYSGKIEMSSDHLINDLDNSNSDNLKFSLGGPVLGPLASDLKSKFTFFFNGAANWHDSRYQEYYKSSPNMELSENGNDILVSSYEATDPYDGRDDFIGFDLGERNYNLYNANIKMKYVFNPRQNVTFAIRGDQNKWYPYEHTWKYSLDNYAEVESSQRQYVATYDHLFQNNTMNLKIKAGYYEKSSYQAPRGISRDDYFVRTNTFIWEDPNGFDPYYSLTSINTSGINVLTDDGLTDELDEYSWAYYLFGNETGINDFVQPGSIYRFNIDDKNETFTFRSDFEYQINRIHGLKTGLELIKHTITKDQLRAPWEIDPNRYQEYLELYAEPFDSVSEGDPIIDNWEDSPTYGVTLEESAPDSLNFYRPEDLYAAILAASGSRDGYEAEPWQAAYYLQDKMEWEGMIVNAGLRFDFWYLGEKYKVFRDAGNYEWVDFDKDDRMQLMISPRLGVSHPISESTVMHFAYNYQNQLPQMQYIFTSVTPQDAIVSDNAITIGKLDLEPQITVTYEVGLQKQLSEDYVLDLTAYYKNIYNYVSSVKYYLQDDGSLVPWYNVDPGDSNVDTTTELYGYISENYGSTRGIDLNLQKMLSNFISGSVSYSLGWAEGNDSGVNATQDEDTRIREFPLDWDIRHSASANLTFRIAKGEEFYFPFTDFKLPFDDFTMNFIYNIESGRPYTAQTPEDTEEEVNQERMPYTEDASLKISKRFSFSDRVNIKLYCNIDNLFNKRNYLEVYPKTGSPYYDGEDLSEGGYTAPETQYIHDLFTKDPRNWSQGRTITFGFAFNW